MSKFVNTYENHPKDMLKTHWFQARYMDCRNAIIDIARDLKMNVVNINDEYYEIFVVDRNYKLMLKVTQFSFNEASIDLYLEILKPYNFFAWKNFINTWHRLLSKKLPFIGIALHS